MDDGAWTRLDYMQFPERNDAYHTDKAFAEVLARQIVTTLRA